MRNEFNCESLECPVRHLTFVIRHFFGYPVAAMARFFTIFLLLTLSLGGGYICRRLNWLGERTARWLMTAVAVIGYPVINLLALWNTPLQASDLWLPAQSVAQMLVLAAIALVLARFLTRDRGEEGLFAITSAFGNHGLTMGGFVVFLLFGEHALGLASIYFMLFAPMTVLLAYPLARHYATEHPSGTLARLLVRSLFDWRSMGLPISLLGIALSPSVYGYLHGHLTSVPGLGWIVSASPQAVRRPEFIDQYKLVDILMYAINVAAYFGIGLQLRMSYVPALKKLIAGLAFMRYFVGAATGLGLIVLTCLTPWPMKLDSLAGKVAMIESFVSTAVTCVAVASMFGLKPREASVLFVTNTLTYLICVLPIVLWIYR
jgi:predicted permease